MSSGKEGVPATIPYDVWQPLMEVRAQLDALCPGSPTPVEEVLRELVAHYKRCAEAVGEADDFCARAQAWKR